MNISRRGMLIGVALGLAGCTGASSDPNSNTDGAGDAGASPNADEPEEEPDSESEPDTESETEYTDAELETLFEEFLSGSDVRVRSVDREGDTLVLVYVPSGVTESDVAGEIGTIAGAYAAIIEEGTSAERLDARVVNPESGEQIGSWYVETSWARDFADGDISNEEFALEIFSTLEVDAPEQEAPTVEVRIHYAGEWSGTVGHEGGVRSVEGEGTEIIPIEGNPSIVSANAQKQDDSNRELVIQILVDGEAVAEERTSAGYGVAQVSTQVG